MAECPPAVSAPIAVTYFHRKPRPNANFSIELVFEIIRRELADKIHAQVCVAPCASNGLFRRLRIAWHARQRQGEINHVTGDTNFTALALDGSRTILTNHDCGYIVRKQGLRRKILQYFWLQLPVRHVAAVTTISEQIKAEIIEFSGCPPEKIHVIPNPLPPGFEYRPHEFNAECPRILHVGTTDNKNLPRLIEAVTGLKCLLAIVGPLSPPLLQQLRDAQVDFENYTNLTSSKMICQYEQSDLVCFASLYEGFGVPIIEAQSIGRPLVTSNRRPMSDVAGPGACLVDPKDVAEIRQAIIKIQTDSQFRRRVVDAGRINVERFAPERIADRYLRLYEQVRQNAVAPLRTRAAVNA